MPSVPPPSVPVRPVYVPQAPIIIQPHHHRCSCCEADNTPLPWPVIAFFVVIFIVVGLMMLDVFWMIGKDRWADFQMWCARKKREKEWQKKNPNKELPKYPWDIR